MTATLCRSPNNRGFFTHWADGRQHYYQNITSGFIDDGGSRCHEDFFPERGDGQSGGTSGGNGGEGLGVDVPDGGAHYTCDGGAQLVFAPPQNVLDANGVVLGRYSIDEALVEIRAGASIYEYEIAGNELRLRQREGVDTLGAGNCEFVEGARLQPVQLESDTGYLCAPYNDTLTTWVWDFRRDGIFDENGIKTGEWVYLDDGGRIRALPDRNDPVIVREQSDRTLRLFNDNGNNWGCCEITEGAQIERIDSVIHCGQTHTASVSACPDALIVEIFDSGAGRFSLWPHEVIPAPAAAPPSYVQNFDNIDWIEHWIWPSQRAGGYEWWARGEDWALTPTSTPSFQWDLSPTVGVVSVCNVAIHR